VIIIIIVQNMLKPNSQSSHVQQVLPEIFVMRLYLSTIITSNST